MKPCGGRATTHCRRSAAGALGAFLGLALWSGSVAAADVTVLGLFPDMAVVQVDGRRHTLRVGQSTPEGIRLLRADSDSATVEIDGRKETLELGSPSVSTRYQSRQSMAEIWPTNGMYLADGSINRQPVRFLVDTGASWVAMGPGHARRLGIDFRAAGKAGYANTASGMVRVYEVTLDSVKLGEIDLRGVKAAVIDSATAGDTILLGMSFLERVEMQRQGEMLQLRQKF